MPAQGSSDLAIPVTLDMESGPGFDKFVIGIAVEGKPELSFALAKTEMPIDESKSGTVHIDLTPFAGQDVKLVFDFNTVDNDFNTTTGIAIGAPTITTKACGGLGTTCVNEAGGFTCPCANDYLTVGDKCVDPCFADNGGCAANAACSVKDQVVVCTCNPGFAGDSKTCSATGCSAESCESQSKISVVQNGKTFECKCGLGCIEEGGNCCKVDPQGNYVEVGPGLPVSLVCSGEC